MNDFDNYDEHFNLNQTPVNQPFFLEPEEYSNSYSHYTCNIQTSHLLLANKPYPNWSFQ